MDDHRFLELTDQAAFEPAPYLARARWVAVKDRAAVDTQTLRELIERSHALVLARLPKRVQAEIGGARS